MTNKEVFESIAKTLHDLDDKFPEEFAETFIEKVKGRTPVDEGTLQRGWKAVVRDTSIDISNDVPYAGYVEDGTEKMAGAHMLKTTMAEIDTIADRIVKDIK